MRRKARVLLSVCCISFNMSLFKIAACVSTLLAPVLAITVDTTDSAYTVNTESGNGLKATISRSSCDITSLIYRSTDYQYSSQSSHIASGLGSSVSVSYTTKGMHAHCASIPKHPGTNRVLQVTTSLSSALRLVVDST